MKNLTNFHKTVETGMDLLLTLRELNCSGGGGYSLIKAI